jgi:hypothetical protein
MKRSIVLACALLALSACGKGEEEKKAPEKNAADLVAEASVPFSIGNTYANEMGEVPRSEADTLAVDPYEQMVRDEAASRNTAAPAQ